MRRSSRVIASTLGLALTLTACGGQSSSIPWTSTGDGGSDSAARTAKPDRPLVSIPQLSGDLAYTDTGRRAANAPVRVQLVLRYNNQAELGRFVASISDARSGLTRRALTPKQFNDRYAPTALQEERVVSALERAGFKIVKRFPNRTIVDAIARTSDVERFFSTEIHTVHQGKYGERFTNVKPATLPHEIASLVRDVSLDNLIVVRTVADQSGVENQRSAPVFQRDALGRVSIPMGSGGIRPNDSSGNLVNGGFETGAFSPGWINESTRSRYAAVTTQQAHSGSYSAFMGTLSKPEVNGWGSVAQLVKVPANGVLSFWVYQGTNEVSTTYAWQAAYLLNQSGTILDTFYKIVQEHPDVFPPEYRCEVTRFWASTSALLSRWGADSAGNPVQPTPLAPKTPAPKTTAPNLKERIMKSLGIGGEA